MFQFTLLFSVVVEVFFLLLLSWAISSSCSHLFEKKLKKLFSSSAAAIFISLLSSSFICVNSLFLDQTFAFLNSLQTHRRKEYMRYIQRKIKGLGWESFHSKDNTLLLFASTKMEVKLLLKARGFFILPIVILPQAKWYTSFHFRTPLHAKFSSHTKLSLGQPTTKTLNQHTLLDLLGITIILFLCLLVLQTVAHQ